MSCLMAQLTLQEQRSSSFSLLIDNWRYDESAQNWVLQPRSVRVVALNQPVSSGFRSIPYLYTYIVPRMFAIPIFSRICSAVLLLMPLMLLFVSSSLLVA